MLCHLNKTTFRQTLSFPSFISILLLLLSNQLCLIGTTRGQSCSANAVFPRTFGVTDAIDGTQGSLRKIYGEHKLALVSELDTLIVASKTNYDPLTMNYGQVDRSWATPANFDISAGNTYTLLSFYPTDESKSQRQIIHKIIDTTNENKPLNVACLHRKNAAPLSDADFQDIMVSSLNQADILTFDSNQQAVCVLNVIEPAQNAVQSLTFTLDLGNPQTGQLQVRIIQFHAYPTDATLSIHSALTIVSAHKLQNGQTFLVNLHIFGQDKNNSGLRPNRVFFNSLMNFSDHNAYFETQTEDWTQQILPLSDSPFFVAFVSTKYFNDPVNYMVVYEYDFTQPDLNVIVGQKNFWFDSNAYYEFYTVGAVAEVDSQTYSTTLGGSFYVGLVANMVDRPYGAFEGLKSLIVFADLSSMRNNIEIELFRPNASVARNEWQVKGFQCKRGAMFRCSLIGQEVATNGGLFFVQFEDTDPGMGVFAVTQTSTLVPESDAVFNLVSAVPHSTTLDAGIEKQSFIYAFNAKKQGFWTGRTTENAGTSSQFVEYSHSEGGLYLSSNSVASKECDRYLGWKDRPITIWRVTTVNKTGTIDSRKPFTTLNTKYTDGSPASNLDDKDWWFYSTLPGASKLELPIFDCNLAESSVAIEGVLEDETFNCELSSQTPQTNLVKPQLVRSCKDFSIRIPYPEISAATGSASCRESFSEMQVSIKYAADGTDLMQLAMDPNNFRNDCVIIANQGFNDPLKCKALQLTFTILVGIIGTQQHLYPTDRSSPATLTFSGANSIDLDIFEGVELLMQMSSYSLRYKAEFKKFKFSIGVPQPEIQQSEPAQVIILQLSFSMTPASVYQLETPQTRQISLGSVQGASQDQVDFAIEVNKESYEKSPVVEFDKTTNTLTLTSKKEFFTSLYKDKVSKKTVGLMIQEEIELDLEILLLNTVSQEVKQYLSKLKLTRFLPIVQTTTTQQSTTETQQAQQSTEQETIVTNDSSTSETAQETQTTTVTSSTQNNSTISFDEIQIPQNITSSSGETEASLDNQIELVYVLAAKISQEIGLDSVEVVQIEQVSQTDEPPAKTAQFDLESWTQSNQLSDQIASKEVIKVNKDDSFALKQKKVLKNIEKTFVVPKLKKVSKTGQMGIEMSNKIQVRSFQDILDQFRGKNRKLASQIKQKTEETFSEIDKIDALFKAAGFIIVKLIPGGQLEQKVEAREFDWKLKTYEEDQIEIQVKFKKPELISMGEFPDKLEILFTQAQFYLQPVIDGLQSMPDGFQILKILPPQRNPDQSFAIEEASVKENMQGFVITQFLMAFVLNFSLQTIFSAILSFQILAYLPLLNVPIPGEGFLFFETLAAIVSFDFLPIFDYWDAGFTSTDALTPGFQMLKFESLNFVESMGGVLIIGVLMLIWPLIAIFVTYTGLINKLRSQRQNFEALRIKQSLMGFMYGSSFDIIIAASLAVYSLELMEVFGMQDYISLFFMVIFCLTLIIFMALVTKFSLITSNRISTKEQAKLIQQNEELVDRMYQSFQSRHLCRYDEDQQQLMGLSNQSQIHQQKKIDRVNLIVEKTRKEKEILLEKAKNLTEVKIEIYQPLISGLKLRKKDAISYPLLFIVRRFVTLAIILFLRDYPAFQVLSFMATCLFNVAYLTHTMPFTSKFDNIREILQEFCLLECSILYMMLVTLPDGSEATGQIAYLIVAVAVVDVMPVLITLVVDTVKFLVSKVKQKFSVWKLRRQLKVKLRKMQQQSAQEKPNLKHSSQTLKTNDSYRKRPTKLESNSVFYGSKKSGDLWSDSLSELQEIEDQRDEKFSQEIDIETAIKKSVENKKARKIDKDLSSKEPKRVITQKISFKKNDLFATHLIDTAKYLEPLDSFHHQSSVKTLIRPEGKDNCQFSESSLSSIEQQQNFPIDKNEVNKKYLQNELDPVNMIVKFETLDKKQRTVDKKQF